MFKIDQGNMGINHRAHFGRKATCSVDHMLCNERAFLGHHLPFARRQRIDFNDTIEAMNFCARFLR